MMLMKGKMIPESDRYFANTFFIMGFALLSFVGGMILESVKLSDMSLFNFMTTSLFLFSFIGGFVSLAIGWYTLGHRELRDG
jgi:hypothetical protein